MSVSGWIKKPLGEFATVRRGASPRPIEDPKWWGDEIGWVRISDVTASRKYLHKTRDRLSKLGARHSVTIDAAQVILSICATIGRPIITTKQVCIHDGFVWFDRLGPEVDREYLYYFLSSKEEFLSGQRQTGTQGNLNTSIVSQLELLLPESKREQAKLAEVLATVDVAIEQTETMIAKQRRIRTGLMKDLLTRGIDGHGNLRTEKTHEFKDSPLGRIPVEWNVKTIDELALHVGSGVTPTGGDTVYTAEGVLFIRSQNVHFGGLRLDDVAWIPTHIHESMLRSEVFENDVLLNITGASIGRCCPMPKFDGKANVNQHVCAIRIGQPTAFDAGLLSAIIESHIGQNQIAQFNAGGNREGLNYQQVRSFRIPWPATENERLSLYKVICQAATALVEYEGCARKLRSLKTALMQDLLTGRRRVTALLTEPLEAVA